MRPAPIYLLINGEPDGPHEAEAIVCRMDPDTEEDEPAQQPLDQETLSCIEGMPGWRTLPETLVWSYA